MPSPMLKGSAFTARSVAFILALWVLAIAALDLPTFRPNMDSMTYGVLARNVLATGDWRTLHYLPDAYPDFHQHPPLGVWMLAAFFSVAGVSNFAMKLASTLLNLGVVLGVAAWAACGARTDAGRARSDGLRGLLAGLLLLLSPLYLKASAGYLLDLPLTLFLVASGFLLHVGMGESVASRRGAAVFFSGVFFAAALLAKGLPALVMLPVWAGAVVFVEPKHRLNIALGFFAGAVLPLAAFGVLGEGMEFVRHYWAESVAPRVGSSASVSHSAALKALLVPIWPALPFWVWGLSRVVRGGFRASPQSWIPVGLALGIVAGFSLNGRFLPHYLLPFFACAAVTAAAPLSDWAAPRLRYALLSHFAKALIGLPVVLLLASLLFPEAFHGRGGERPIRRAVERAARDCAELADGSKPERILFMGSVLHNPWEARALGAWETPWWPQVRARGDSKVPSAAASGASPLVLVYREGDPSPENAGWSVTSIVEGPFRIAVSPKTAGGCAASPAAP